MRILCIGDIVSAEGVDYLIQKLPRLRREYGADIIIVNGENSAIGNGIDKIAYDGIMQAGADVVTGGNHSFQKKSAGDLHSDEKRLLRPANVKEFTDGTGVITLDMGRYSLRVINISGSLYMKEECVNPFDFMDGVDFSDKRTVTVVDFHAEATSEKRAMGFLLDGKASLVFGTHTHVQTNDAQVLPNGTGYITDIGMTGVLHSVLGKDAEVCVHNFKTPNDRKKIQDAKGKCRLSGIFAEIDIETKKCTEIKAFNI